MNSPHVNTPPWLADLPRDNRGFIVSCSTPWPDGVPRLSLIATDRKVALAFRRACAVCGYILSPGFPVYRAFSQGDAANIRMYEKDHSHDLGGPAHLSCILYSAFACPYLRQSGARLGKDSLINPGARRGGRAAVMGFEDATLLIYAAPHSFLSDDSTQPHLGYQKFIADIPYRTASELADMYAAAVEEDATTIDTGDRSFWSGSTADERGLLTVLDAAFRALSRRTPDYLVDMQGDRFGAFKLPLSDRSNRPR